MREFFRGWRRKAGCVALVMAVAFAGVWARSLIAMDAVELETGSSTYALMSAASQIGFSRRTWVNGNDEPPRFDYGYGTGDLSEWNTFDPFADFESVEWRFGWAGAQVAGGVWPATDPMRIEACFIPHWMFILPMTLLSAYLILWPGKRKLQSSQE